MSSIEEAIRWKFESAIKMTDMNEANEALRDIVAEHGIGVATLSRGSMVSRSATFPSP